MNTWLLRFKQSVCVLALVALPCLAQSDALILPGTKPSSSQRYQVWGFEIYDARLWTRPEFSVPQYSTQNFGLELTYLRKFDGKDIAKRSIEEMKRVGKFNADQEATWLKAMTTIFPAVGLPLLTRPPPLRSAGTHRRISWPRRGRGRYRPAVR